MTRNKIYPTPYCRVMEHPVGMIMICKETPHDNNCNNIERVDVETALYGCLSASAVQCLNSASASVLVSVPFSEYICWALCIASVFISSVGYTLP